MITPESRAKDFPSLLGKSYLNTAAESIPPQVVVTAVQEYLNDKLLGMDGRDGHFAREAQTREVAGQLLGLSASEIGLCSCSAEAYNLLASALDLKSDSEVIISDLDFPSGATPWLTAKVKPVVHVWKSRDGALDLADLIPLLNSRTRLVQVSLVSFYNGWRLPWQPFVAAVRANAPQVVISADLTQALGRCVLDISGADIVISSTHKWLLGLHGGCIVGVPEASAEKLTTTAGGWYHLQNAFDADRFERAKTKPGAASFSVGMPSFAPIYALHASISYLLSIGVENIARYADPLVLVAHQGLKDRGVAPLAPFDPDCHSGIVAFRHDQSDRIQADLRSQNVHIMHQAGRMRLAMHGYNTDEDLQKFFQALDKAL